MNTKVQILVLSITGIANVSKEDMGRYSVVVPISDSVTHNLPHGTEVEFFDRAGNTLKGRVVNKRQDIECGKFPDVKGLIIDTKFNTDIVPERKRMQQGGINRIPQRTPTPAKLNKRTQPDMKRA